MKYFRLIETDCENEYCRSHLFIKEPETEEEKARFEALKNLIPILEEIDIGEEFEDYCGDVEEESYSHFEFAKDNGGLVLFEGDHIDLLFKEERYLRESFRVVTLSDNIFNYDEENKIEALNAFVSRTIFKSCERAR